MYNNGDPDGGVAELRKALAIKADDKDALSSLGAMLANRHEYGEAESCLRKLVRFYPQDAGAHYNYGAILAADAKWDAAAAEFSEALRLRPDFAEAKQGLEVARERGGK